MKQDTTERHNLSIGCRDILTDILRQGAQEMLAEAIKNEVVEYVARVIVIHEVEVPDLEKDS